MKTKKIFLLALVLVLSGCSQQLTTPAKESIIEGTVKYLPGNGAEEVWIPPGFILNDYQWITTPIDSTNHGFIYLMGRVDSSYLDKHIRVVGKVSPSTIYNLIMDVDTVRVIN